MTRTFAKVGWSAVTALLILVAAGCGRSVETHTPYPPPPTLTEVPAYPPNTSPSLTAPVPSPTSMATPTPTGRVIPTAGGAIPLAITAEEAQRVVLDRMQGLSTVRVQRVRLVAARQLAAWRPSEYAAYDRVFGGEREWCDVWQAPDEDSPVYVIEATGVEDPALYPSDRVGGLKPAIADVVMLVDGLTGRFLAQEDYDAGWEEWWGALSVVPTPEVRIVPRQPWRPTPTATWPAPETPIVVPLGPTPTPGPTWTALPTPTLPPITATVTVDTMLRYLPLQVGNRWEYAHSGFNQETGWWRDTVRQTVTSVRRLGPNRVLAHVATTGGHGVLPDWLLVDGGLVYQETDDGAAELLRAPDASREAAPLFAVYPWRGAGYYHRPAVGGTLYVDLGLERYPLSSDLRECYVVAWIVSAGFSTDSWLCPGRGIVRRQVGFDHCGFVERHDLTRFVPATR